MIIDNTSVAIISKTSSNKETYEVSCRWMDYKLKERLAYATIIVFPDRKRMSAGYGPFIFCSIRSCYFDSG